MPEWSILENLAEVSPIELFGNVLFPAPHDAPILDGLSAGDLVETPTVRLGAE
jgi:hypothetical protein